MPKKGQITVTTRRFQDEEEPEPIQEAPAQDLTWTAFKGKFAVNKGSRVKVYRMTPRGRQFCFADLPSAIESEETIRSYHAGSTFAHEEGHYLLGLETDGVMGDLFEVQIAPQAHAPGSQGPQSGGMSAGLERILMSIDQRLSQREQTPMSEMVMALAELDKMRGGQQNQLTPQTMIDLMKMGMEMGGKGGGGDWTDKLFDAVKENGPLLLNMWQQMNQQKPPQQLPPPAPAPAQPAAQAEPQPHNQETEMEQSERAMLAMTFEYLKKKALANSDPGLYIDLVLDNQEMPVYARLLREIADKDFSTFAKFDPDIEKPQYRAFFYRIYDGLRSVIVKNDPVAATSGGATGNQGHASTNGTAGKGGKK